MLVRTIRSRGANIVVEANAEVLFLPQTDVGRWSARFTRKVKDFSQAYAPINKRPRWSHYGKPLKETFSARTKFYPNRMKIHSAVGSSSPHAWYVDQGTGIYAGSGPYPAKILPPWSAGDGSLYEQSWHPNGSYRGANGVVMIKGQKGQGFFDRGLKRGFQFMRMRSYQIPDEGLVSKAMSSFPAGLSNFLGNTAATPAFRAQLEQWRSWRDAAYARNHLNSSRYDSRAALTNVLRANAIAAIRRQNAKQAAMSKAARDLAASKAAADRRARAQKAELLKQKKIREAARAVRVERERLKRVNYAHQRARAEGQKLKNRDYTVFLRPVKNSLGTEVVGYDLFYTAPGQTQQQVKHFR